MDHVFGVHFPSSSGAVRKESKFKQKKKLKETTRKEFFLFLNFGFFPAAPDEEGK